MEILKKILAQEDTVLFIGSGISVWSGLPSWASMIEELARYVESAGANADLVRTEAQKGDLLQAASYGFDKLTKQQIGEFIRAACHYGVAKPHEIHHKVISLGPRCFITTNYDNLIEESLSKWQPDRFYKPPVTNRHLTETAEIVHARAIDFIFKPHGDAADSESIILTREQYRQLLPQGERHAALETLKMLLVARPIVYVGFGLRDPDFIYIRDILANTYKGGTRDHYAIMADVSEAETDYWRRNYGIHLVSYATIERPDKTIDHTALLILLDSLVEKAPVTSLSDGFDPCSSDVVLALARHAARLSQSPKLTTEFKIRVHAETEKRRQYSIFYKHDKFDHISVEEFLDNGPERAILIGLPGAGKTYSLRRAAARLAELLNEYCLSEHFDKKSIVVPILVDLKLYRGDLIDLVSKTLPKRLPFDEITKLFKVKIFLDSFNEIPRDYLESGSYESDFLRFVTKINGASLIISSRTSDGLDKLELPAYSLDLIDESTMTTELKRLGIEIKGRFEHEVKQLLQRPFYFQYVINGEVKLPKEPHPRDFYHVFFDNLHKAFINKYYGHFDIEGTLSLAAYNALNQGEEAFLLSELIHLLKENLKNTGLNNIDCRDVANWLVSASILIPNARGRIAFVHQSMTEYLAAMELARRYEFNPNILIEKLSLPRWDQSLFLTLGLLQPEKAEEFLQDVIKADFALALNASKYLEVGRDEVVSRLLSEIPERIHDYNEYDWEISKALRYGLSFTESHEVQIRKLIDCGYALGSEAVSSLVALKGEEVKDELLHLLVERRNDFNFCVNGIARSLKQFSNNNDVKQISNWADDLNNSVEQESDDDISGFISGAAGYLSGLDLSVIRQEFFEQYKTIDIPWIKSKILCRILQNNYSTASLDLASELLLRDIKEAAVTIYFISKHSEPDEELSWDSFNSMHVEKLIFMLFDEKETWTLDALKCLCAARPDLEEIVRQAISGKYGIEKVLLLHCISPTDFTPVFEELSELINISDEDRRKQPIHMLNHLELDWKGREELFAQLLRLRDIQLTSILIGGVIPIKIVNLENLDIGPIEWVLNWMLELTSNEHCVWYLNQLGALFAGYLKREVQDEFLAEFNKPESEFRQILFKYILPYRSDITTDDFSEDAISFLLSDLNRERSVTFLRGNLLGRTATEQFVTEYLLPLLAEENSTLLINLKLVLKEIGTRHGRRYFLE